MQDLKKLSGENFHDIGFGNGFLNMTPKAQITKEKIEKLYSMKIFKFQQ